MAKKKNAPVKTAAKKKSAKKPAVKASAKKATRKPGKKKTVAKPKAPTSVDGVLKKFEKERVTSQARLASCQKKIQELEAKTIAYRQQIEKLSILESETKTAIAELDSKRDAEVGEVLARLGVNLGCGQTVSYPSEPASAATSEQESSSDRGAASDSETNSSEEPDGDSDAKDGDDSEEEG